MLTNGNSRGLLLDEEFGLDGTVKIKLEGKLLQDDTAKLAQARMACEKEVALVPDRWIYDKIRKIYDADNIEQPVSAPESGTSLGLFHLMS